MKLEYLNFLSIFYIFLIVMFLPVKSKKDANIVHRIIGGNETDITEYPFIVSIEGAIFGHFCGGSIMSVNWILTAGHCVQQQGSVLPTKCCYIVAGVSDVLYPFQKNKQKIDIEGYIPHQNFCEETMFNDIACIKLKKDLVFNEYVQPVHLPTEQYKNEIIEIVDEIVVIGWGDTDIKFSSNMLKCVAIPVIYFDKCSSLSPHTLSAESQLCTMFKEGGIDACQGDSGGPLVSRDDRNLQLGIVSYGIGCGRPNVPGINTRVDFYLKFIKSCMNGELPLQGAAFFGSNYLLITFCSCLYLVILNILIQPSN